MTDTSPDYTRRAPFHPLLNASNFHHISACNPYRQRLDPSESDAAFVARKTAELEAEFARLGPHTVAAVVLVSQAPAVRLCLYPFPSTPVSALTHLAVTPPKTAAPLPPHPIMSTSRHRPK